MIERPDGWAKTSLTSILISSLGGDWGKDCDHGLNGYEKVRVVRGTDFKDWKVHRAARAAERCVKQSSLASRRLAEGDIVVEVSGGGPTQPVGRTILIDKATLDSSSLPLVCSNFFRQVRLHELIDSVYVKHFLSHAYSKGEFDEFQTQTTNLRNLNFTNFLEGAYIDLPPLNEQHRIVAKLEKLLSRVDAARTRLATIPRILNPFRQSVLAAACSGRLTIDWREQNTHNISAQTIVDSLFERRISEAETTPKENKIRSIYEYQEEGDSDTLPEAWKFVALNKLSESFDYGTSSKSQTSGLVPVLRMGNIRNGEVDWSDLVYTSDEDEIAKYILEPKTVLFNRTNSPELVGKTAIYRGEQPAIFAGYLIRINNSGVLDSAYLNYCLNSTYARGFCLSTKTDGVSQSNINAQKLGKFEVPFCPLPEQQEIVNRVEALFKTADALEARYRTAKGHVDKLTQSILAKAFRGELVPQDPNDEPASALLERIRENRNGTTRAGRKAAKKKRKKAL